MIITQFLQSHKTIDLALQSEKYMAISHTLIWKHFQIWIISTHIKLQDYAQNLLHNYYKHNWILLLLG